MEYAACNIALIKPPETNRYHAGLFRKPGEESPMYDPALDKWIGVYKDMINRISDEWDIDARIHEHQLTDSGVHTDEMGFLNDTDVIAATDPSEKLLTMIQVIVRKKPAMRSLVA